MQAGLFPVVIDIVLVATFAAAADHDDDDDDNIDGCGVDCCSTSPRRTEWSLIVAWKNERQK